MRKREVDRAIVGHPAHHRVDDHCRDTLDEGEVPALGAVAVHGQGDTAESRAHEGRHRRRVCVAGGLQRAEDVEEPKWQDVRTEAG